MKEYLNKIIDSEKVELNENVYRNLNILKDNSLSLGGLLFFAKEPQKYRPAFCIKAVSFVAVSYTHLDVYKRQGHEDGYKPRLQCL